MSKLLAVHQKRSDPRSSAGRPDNQAALLGQVMTADSLARQIVDRLLHDRTNGPLRILDPAVGPSTFPRAIFDSRRFRAGDNLLAVDLDPRMVKVSKDWARRVRAPMKVQCADYLRLSLAEPIDVAILNPPYIRQEWIDDKRAYSNLIHEMTGDAVPGTSNLYVYFLAKVIADLKPGGTVACLIYDSWQSTRFGQWLQRYLEKHCEEVTFEAAPRQPFHGRLIDATVIYAKKLRRGAIARPRSNAIVSATELERIDGFAPVGQLFDVRRGLRLKQANFFLVDGRQDRIVGASPFVKKLRSPSGYAVPLDHHESALLLEEGARLAKVDAELGRRLSAALLDPEANQSILTWYRERPSVWKFHRSAPYSRILFNYYLRNRPKHVFNASRGFSDNFYGVNTPPSTARAWLAILNSSAVCAELLANSRNQGNGLVKLQLFEYRRTLVPDASSLDRGVMRRFDKLGNELINDPDRSNVIIRTIDELIFDIYSHPRLEPGSLKDFTTHLSSTVRQPRARA